jgi:outer membrane protein OmpA-like peptidoglycan-associated protein
MTMKRITAVILTLMVMLILAGCSIRTRIVSEPTAPQGVAEPSQRITEAVIEQDIAYIEELRLRLATLNAAGIAIDNYHFCKAQAWIDMAFDEYSENDRTPVIAAALEQAQTIIAGLEAGSDEISMETAVIATSKRIREDLWQFAEQVKQQPDFGCAACRLARLEVQLVWIGHEENELGWRHAVPGIMAAERLQREVQTAAASCKAAMVHVSLQRQVYFASERVVISQSNRETLDWVASPALRPRMQGHTDAQGGVAYNLTLPPG